MLKRMPTLEHKADDEISALIQRANQLIKEQKLVPALEITTQLKTCLDQDKTLPKYYHLPILTSHATALEKNNRLEDAIAIQRQMLQLNPYKWTSYIVLAAFERKRDWWVDMRTKERQVLETFFAEANKAPASKKPSAKEYEQARRALALNYKQELFGLIKKAYSFFNNHQFALALELTKQLMVRLDQDKKILNDEIDETQFSILHVHAQVLEKNNKYQDSIDVTKTILKLRPYHWISYLSIANMERKQGNPEGQYPILQTLLQTAEHAPQAEKPTPRQFAQAYNNLAIYFQGKENNGNTLNYKAQLKEALAYALKAEQYDPSYGPALSTLGHIYEDLGYIKKAYEYYEKAYHVEPERLDRNHPDFKQIDHVEGKSELMQTEPPKLNKVQIDKTTKKTNLVAHSKPVKLSKPQTLPVDKKKTADKTEVKNSEKPKQPKLHLSSTIQATKKLQQVFDEQNVALSNSFSSLFDDSSDSPNLSSQPPKKEKVSQKAKSNTQPAKLTTPTQSVGENVSKLNMQKSRQTDNYCVRLRNGFFSRVSACTTFASTTAKNSLDYCQQKINSVAGYLNRK